LISNRDFYLNTFKTHKLNPIQARNNALIAEKLSSLEKIQNLKSDSIPNDLNISNFSQNIFPISSFENFSRSLSENFNSSSINKIINGKMKFNKGSLLKNNRKAYEDIKKNISLYEIKPSDVQSFKEIINDPIVIDISKDQIIPFVNENLKFFDLFNSIQSSDSNIFVLDPYLKKIKNKSLNKILENNRKLKSIIEKNFDKVKFSKNSIERSEIDKFIAEIHKVSDATEEFSLSKTNRFIENLNNTFISILNTKKDEKGFQFNFDTKKFLSNNVSQKFIENNKNFEKNLKMLDLSNFSKASEIKIDKVILEPIVITLSSEKTNKHNFVLNWYTESKKEDDVIGKLIKNRVTKLNKIKDQNLNLISASARENRNLLSEDYSSILNDQIYCDKIFNSFIKNFDLILKSNENLFNPSFIFNKKPKPLKFSHHNKGKYLFK